MKGIVRAVDDKEIVPEHFFLQLAGTVVVVAFRKRTFAVENINITVCHGERMRVDGCKLRDVFYVECKLLLGRCVRLEKEGIACGIVVPHPVGIDMQQYIAFLKFGRNYYLIIGLELRYTDDIFHGNFLS